MRQRRAAIRPPEIVLRPPIGVILDLDGTLVDTAPARVDAWLAALAAAGFHVRRSVVARRIGVDGRQLAQEVASLAGVSLDGSTATSIDNTAGELFRSRCPDPRPLPGASALVRTLNEQSLPWAIATSSRPAEASRSLARMAVDWPPIVIDASSVVAAKPAPDLLIAAAELLGVDPAGCWAIGDSIWDIRAAKAAGMIPIAVTAGSAVGQQTLRTARPTAVGETLEDVVRLVKRSKI